MGISYQFTLLAPIKYIEDFTLFIQINYSQLMQGLSCNNVALYIIIDYLDVITDTSAFQTLIHSYREPLLFSSIIKKQAIQLSTTSVNSQSYFLAGQFIFTPEVNSIWSHVDLLLLSNKYPMATFNIKLVDATNNNTILELVNQTIFKYTNLLLTTVTPTILSVIEIHLSTSHPSASISVQTIQIIFSNNSE